MITPEFSGQRVRSPPAIVDQIPTERLKVQQPRLTPESARRQNRHGQRGDIYVEKHGEEELSSEENPPRGRRREFHANYRCQIPPRSVSSSLTKQHIGLAQELRKLNKKLDLCYEELKSGFARKIAKTAGPNIGSGMFVLF